MQLDTFTAPVKKLKKNVKLRNGPPINKERRQFESTRKERRVKINELLFLLAFLGWLKHCIMPGMLKCQLK